MAPLSEQTHHIKPCIPQKMSLFLPYWPLERAGSRDSQWIIFLWKTYGWGAFAWKKNAHFSVLIKKGGDGGCLEIWNAAIRSSSAPFAPLFPPCSIPSGFSSNMFLVVCPAAWLTVHTLSQHNSAVQKPLKTRRNSISRFLLFFFLTSNNLSWILKSCWNVINSQMRKTYAWEQC